MLEYFRPGIDGTAAANDDPYIIFSEAVFEPAAAVFCPTRSQIHRGGVHSAGTGHHGVGRRAQLEQMILVAPAAERGCGAIGGGDLAIRRHRHVDEEERKP